MWKAGKDLVQMRRLNSTNEMMLRKIAMPPKVFAMALAPGDGGIRMRLGSMVGSILAESFCRDFQLGKKEDGMRNLKAQPGGHNRVLQILMPHQSF